MITVASVPSGHPYTSAVAAAVGDRGVRFLPDPAPFDGAPARQWWPPRWLDPEYADTHADGVDVLHVHFGFDNSTVEELTRLIDVLRRRRIGLVVTVHDLHNPHFRDSTAHLERLGVLVRAADRVITLTGSAANEIADRWGARATVAPHPHVVPLNRIEARGRPLRSSAPVVAVHAKSLRANLDPLAVLPTVVRAARRLSARVRIDVDDTLADPTSPAYRPDAVDRLCAYGAEPGVDVVVHPRFDDSEFWDYLSAVDVAVLPYRFGTHSGWTEACRDLGVSVVAPDCGHWTDQFEVHPYSFGIGRFDPQTLEEALERALASNPSEVDIAAVRRNDLAVVADVHGEVYRELTQAVPA